MAHERFAADSFMPVWVRHEHLARYNFAAQYVKDRHVVDAACGSGVGTARFAEAGAASIHALDLSAESVEAASRVNTFKNVLFAVGDATATKLPAHSADVFISLETIEHIPADDAFLKEVVRVLKPDGLLICSTPNREIVNPGKPLSAKPWNQFHVREYSTAEFVALLGKYFSKIELYGQNPQSKAAAGIIGAFGKVLPLHGAVRMNQFMKLPRLLFDRLEHHAVVPAPDNSLFEYSVAICRAPKAF